MVNYKNEVVEIPINNISVVKEQNRLGSILYVELHTPTKLGSNFIFAPQDKTILRILADIRGAKRAPNIG